MKDETAERMRQKKKKVQSRMLAAVGETRLGSPGGAALRRQGRHTNTEAAISEWYKRFTIGSKLF
jgi:hypothetical protein